MFRFASTLVVFVAMTAAPAFVRGAPAPARAAAPKADARVLPALLQQAEDAVRAKNFKAARDAFLDALSLDKKNQRALEGAGTAYLQLQDFPHAKPLLEQAADAAGTAGLSRSLVLNLSAVHVRQKNPMRATKLVRDYLAARADKVDEQALNAMGVALWQADDSARRGPLFRECAKFYETANAKLESTRPGQKRWGVEWVDQGEWSAREGGWKAQQAVADQKHSER